MSAFALVAELLSIVALVVAAVFAIVWATLRVARGGWREVPAESADGEVRWMTDEGEFYSVTSDEFSPAEGGDGPRLFYRVNMPDDPHREAVAHDERVLRTLAVILGIVATVASFVVSFIK